MEHVLDLVVMGRACRNASNIKNRQPIGKMFVKADFDLPEFYQEIVALDTVTRAVYRVM